MKNLSVDFDLSPAQLDVLVDRAVNAFDYPFTPGESDKQDAARFAIRRIVDLCIKERLP